MGSSAMGLLLLYRLLWLLLTPVALLLLALRLLQGKEDPRRIQERLGWPTRARPEGPLLWFHAASVGELNSLLPVFAALKTAGCGATVLLTTVSRSSARLAPSVLPAGVIHQSVPIDHWLCWWRFRSHWRPDLGVLAEAELWPEIVQAMPRLHLINARMGAASFQRHLRLRWYAAWLFGRCERCFAQSEQDAERFRRLGAHGVVAVGSTKRDAAPLPVDDAIVARLGELFGQRPVVLVASSHADEEIELLRAWWRQDLGDHPSDGAGLFDVAWLMAPRHPQRGAALLAQIEALAQGPGGQSGLRAQLWSRCGADSSGGGGDGGFMAADGCDLVVADVLGAMGSWIAAASVVVIGGSFYPLGRAHGGQNPLEPVALGRPVVCGPDMANFSDVTTALVEAGVLHPTTDADQACTVVRSLLARQSQQNWGQDRPQLQGPSRSIAELLTVALAETQAGAKTKTQARVGGA